MREANYITRCMKKLVNLEQPPYPIKLTEKHSKQKSFMTNYCLSY